MRTPAARLVGAAMVLAGALGAAPAPAGSIAEGFAGAHWVAAGEPAPDWTLPKPDGGTLTLSSLRGQAVVVVFWATWCPYCRRLFPTLERLAARYRDAGLTVVGVDVWDDGNVPAYLARHGFTFTPVLDGEAVAETWEVRGTPTVFVIDREGTVVWRTSNSDPANPALEPAVRRALGLGDEGHSAESR